MKKKFNTTILLATLFLIFGFTSNIVSSFELPITQLATSQTKAGGLAINSLIAGDMNGSKLARVLSSGWLGLGVKATGTNTEINPQVALDVRGAIRLSSLKDEGRQVCANQDGDISDCGWIEFYHTGNNPFTTYTFIVPANVTEFTVELWGAGGMGYFEGSSSSTNRSPDSSSTCVSGNDFYCSDGGSASILKGSTVIAKAFGGKAPTSTNTGGSGGTVDTPTNSKVNFTTYANGDNGGNGSSGQQSQTASVLCAGSNTSKYLLSGGFGGKGGEGGSGGSGKAYIPGQIGGNPGFVPTCDFDPAPKNGIPFKGKNGYDGVRGSGGSGASGHGGSSSYTLNGGCFDDNCLDSQKGYAGGGGGGYIKAKVTASPNETYTIKVSHGGEMTNIPVPSVQGLKCDFQVKWTCFQDVKSGNGGPAFVRISY